MVKHDQCNLITNPTFSFAVKVINEKNILFKYTKKKQTDKDIEEERRKKHENKH